jgi:hypothetical protein
MIGMAAHALAAAPAIPTYLGGFHVKALGSLLVLWCAAGLAAGADLSKIDRQIAKEPAYQNKPHYGLMVFGRDATTRVWLVADGDKVFVDRNANGDLTEAGEKIDLKNPDRQKPEESASQAGLGNVVAPDGKKYRILSIQNVGRQMSGIYDAQKEALKGQKGAEQQLKQLLEQIVAMENYFMVTIALPSGVQQYAALSLADNAKDAPVLHFGGPLKMFLASAQLTRGNAAAELSAFIVTPGHPGKVNAAHGSQVQVLVNCCQEGSVPKDIHPVVEIEFPNKEAGGKPVIMKYELKERC